MKPWLGLFALMLCTAPVVAQVQQDEDLLRELGMGGTFAFGNLAVRDLQRGLDPVQQFKRFFSEAKLPLTSAQEKRLSSVVDAQVDAMVAARNNEEAIRQLNVDYNKKVAEILTQEQRAELRRYRTEQIMMRGGFQALKLVLENAQTPFTPDQEKQVEAVYLDFDKQADQLPKGSKGVADRTELAKLENASLGKVVRLLTPAQRKAVAASRQGAIVSKVRPQE
jgi:hypothetical protein